MAHKKRKSKQNAEDIDSNKNKTYKAKCGGKRKRDFEEMDDDKSDGNESKFPPKKQRKIDWNDDDTESELSESFEGIDFVNNDNKEKTMSIAECILNEYVGKEMPSKIAARKEKQQQMMELDELEEEEDIDLNDNKNKNSNTMKCIFCEMIFDEINLLKQHEKKLHFKKCRFCHLRFPTETEMEQHIYNKHNDDKEERERVINNKMIIDENGNFKVSQNIFYQSKWRQKQMIKQQMTQITDTIIIDETKKGNFKRRRNKTPINTHSFLTKKRNNMNNTKTWKTDETKRFYKILKYTGLDFVIMELLYNKAITKKDDILKLSVSSNDESDKSEIDDNKEWIYRDSKQLKRKYYKEEKTNYDQITEIVRNAKFTKEISDKIAILGKENKFKLKDEDYYKESDDDDDGDMIQKNEIDEFIFNPLAECKDEIEREKEMERNKKMEEKEKVNEWSQKKTNERIMEFEIFKAEQQEYKRRRYQREKEESLNHLNHDDDNIDINNYNNNNKRVSNDNNLDGFNPFSIINDNHYDSDRSVTKTKKK